MLNKQRQCNDTGANHSGGWLEDYQTRLIPRGSGVSIESDPFGFLQRPLPLASQSIPSKVPRLCFVLAVNLEFSDSPWQDFMTAVLINSPSGWVAGLLLLSLAMLWLPRYPYAWTVPFAAALVFGILAGTMGAAAVWPILALAIAAIYADRAHRQEQNPQNPGPQNPGQIYFPPDPGYSNGKINLKIM